MDPQTIRQEPRAAGGNRRFRAVPVVGYDQGMSAWALVPKAWYSWDFSVTAGDRTIARFDLSTWRERGVITIDGIEHRVFRESLLGDFVIERGNSPLARATKQSAFTNTMTFRHDGREYTLRKQSWWKRSFVVLDGEKQIGSLAPTSLWTRRATVDLPAQWPLHLQAFVIWLTLVLWKREAHAGSGSS